MNLTDSADEARFRAQVQGWLAEVLPTVGPAPSDPHDWPARRAYDTAWQAMLHQAGYAGINWPAEHGGRGATPTEHLIFLEESVRAGAPDVGVNFVGLLHAGPTVVLEGRDDQRAAHLPGILRGEQIWCQGFSEPEAGSDLASLRTRAVRDGDHYVVTGQKVWTSYAGVADYCELLVRTDPDAPKHRGISWLIMPMDLPGIEVRPLRTIEGSDEFAELFLDEVRVPVANRVGDENDGWRVTQTTFSFERGTAFVSEMLQSLNLVNDLADLARRLPGTDGPAWPTAATCMATCTRWPWASPRARRRSSATSWASGCSVFRRSADIDFDLDSDQQALQATTRRFAGDRYPLAVVRDHGSAFDRARWRELADLGMFAGGLDLIDRVLVFEELGRALVPGPLVASVLAADLVDGVADGDCVVTIVEGRAQPVLVEHGSAVDVVLVLTDDGVHRLDAAAVVGRSVAQPLDPATPLTLVESLPAGALVADAETVAAWRRTGSLLTAALLVGIAGATTDIAVAYAQDRFQFNRPIGSFQAVKHLLADMFAGAEVARAALYAAGVDARADERALAGVHPGARRRGLHLGGRPAPVPQAGAAARHPVRLGRRGGGHRGRPALNALGRRRNRSVA